MEILNTINKIENFEGIEGTENLLNILNDLKDKNTKQIEKQKNRNKISVIFKLNRLLILTKIIPFLEDEDMYKLGQTCRYFKNVIFSPLGLRIIIRQRQNYEYLPQISNLLEDQVVDQTEVDLTSFDFNKIGNQQLQQCSEEDLDVKYQTLNSVKDFLIIKLKESQECILRLKKDNKNLKQFILQERSCNEKAQKICQKVGAKFEDTEYKYQNLCSQYDQLKKEFSDTVGPLNDKLEKIKKENEQLKQEKSVLIREYKKMREDYNKQEEEIKKMKNMWKKIQNLFENNIEEYKIKVSQQNKNLQLNQKNEQVKTIDELQNNAN